MNTLIKFFIRQKRPGLFLILLASIWCFLGNSVVYLTPLSALKKDYGPIGSLEREMFKCSSGRYSIGFCAKTTIRLKNVQETFRVGTRINDGGLIGGIAVGDTISIYTRHWYQYLLTLGSVNSICQLEKGPDIYYEFEWIKERGLTMIIVSGVICLVFSLFLFLEIETVKMINKKRRV